MDDSKSLGDNFPADNYSYEFREKLHLGNSSTDKFQSLLFSIIPRAIPLCYIENYNFYRKIVRINKFPRIIGSSVGWYFNERFKFFAAEYSSKGTRLIEFQHGGGYGMTLSIPQEFLLLDKDIFYSWGWNINKSKKIKSIPNPCLSKLRNKNRPLLDKILFISTSFPRYHYLFQTALLPDNIQKYFADKKLFLETLKDELRTKILYRLYYEYGWGETESLKEAYPDIKFLIKGNLVNWMKKVKLVVIDHPHTSFLEALSINVPCVFYWDHEVYLMRPEAEEYFEHLRKVGILYKDPESAAEKVNEIYDDALGWWLSSKVQRVRNEFCSRYAYAHKDWLNIWANELKQLI
jgi:putative transferase (TIGR04331 family)